MKNGSKVTNPERYSVQSRAEDAPFAPTSDVTGGAGLFWIQMGAQLDEEPQWNAIYPHWRDQFLLRFARSEPMLASAVYSMATRISTLNYQVNGPPRAKKFASELLDKPGLGDTLNVTIQKMISDLHTSDNGAFLELWKAGNPLSDAGTRPVLGFAHLDSRQCWRSYDPEFPVWYTNPITHDIRKIHRSRITFTSDNPQPVELARGIGFCATSRVLRMARVFKNMQIFLDEKVSGRFTRALGSVSGVTPKQLKDALIQGEEKADSKGFVIYKDIPFLVSPNMEKGSEIKIMLQDLASIPDGFVFRDDADLYAYILAFSFGVDAREFWPATQSGATKADATVQNMKARGRGIGNDIALVENMIREALPDTVSFEFDFTDDDQDKATAEIHQTQAATLQVMYNMGALNSQQVQALAIAHGILDGEVLANNSQPITNDDNPDPTQEGTIDTGTPQAAPAPSQQQGQPANAQDGNALPQGKVMKSYDGYLRSLRGLTRGYWNGELSRFDFVDGMVSTIQRQFEDAWTTGARLNGVEPDERTTEEQDNLDLAINTEISYITGFADAIDSGSKANGGALQPLFDRDELWANGYSKIVNLAQVTSGADLKMRWVYGDTIAHCEDCSQYVGKVFRRSQWKEAGAVPQSSDLACGGWQCACYFEVTNDRKSNGQPPTLIGHKHLHEEAIHAHA